MNQTAEIPSQSKKQVAFSSHLVMVRPFRFYSNQQTATDNIYQAQVNLTKEEINTKAIQQFDCFVIKLRQNHVKVTVVQDHGQNQTPDSIYPNNWISFHEGNHAVLYPMYAANRRQQRNIPLRQTLEKQLNVQIQVLYDYAHFQNQNMFLQGTGSMILDRQNKICYAVISQRTHKKLLQKFCLDLGYKECSFHASQYSKQRNENIAIYHTNVLMSLSRHFALISFALIDSEQQKNTVRKTLKQQSKKHVIQLSEQQISHFAGNALTVVSQKGEDLLIMSETAFKSLTQQQIQQIQKWTKIVYSDLNTIETNGGGSARCMLAQVF